MKQALPDVILLAFVGIGVAEIFKSDWFVKRSGNVPAADTFPIC